MAELYIILCTHIALYIAMVKTFIFTVGSSYTISINFIVGIPTSCRKLQWIT